MGVLGTSAMRRIVCLCFWAPGDTPPRGIRGACVLACWPALSVGMNNGLRPGRARDPYKSRHYEAALRSSQSERDLTPVLRRPVEPAARNGHADRVAQCPFSGAKRKTFARIELFRFC